MNRSNVKVGAELRGEKRGLFRQKALSPGHENDSGIFGLGTMSPDVREKIEGLLGFAGTGVGEALRSNTEVLAFNYHG